MPVAAVVFPRAHLMPTVLSTGTVVRALVARTSNREALGDDFGAWITVPGAVMVVGGIAFGVGVARSGALPPWTGWAERPGHPGPRAVATTG